MIDAQVKFNHCSNLIERDGVYFNKGNRNTYVNTLAKMCCKYGVEESECLELIKTEVIGVSRDFPFIEAKTAVKSAYRKYKSEFGIYALPGSKSEARERREPEPERATSYIAPELKERSLQYYQGNNLVKFLLSLFAEWIVTRLSDTYNLGTSKHWDGATIFWQIDRNGGIRSGKVMLYNPNTGKRVKEPFAHITWVHRLLKDDDFNLKQCFFGEHLLSLPDNDGKTIAIVESEKTALISSVYYPQYVWLACGSLNNLTAVKCVPLQGRDVLLFPDLNGFEQWQAKAQELQHMARFKVSDMLESIATPEEKESGLDLADYLVKIPLSEFVKSEFITYAVEHGLPDGDAPQKQLCESYLKRGLSKPDLKDALNELTETHGFVWHEYSKVMGLIKDTRHAMAA